VLEQVLRQQHVERGFDAVDQLNDPQAVQSEITLEVFVKANREGGLLGMKLSEELSHDRQERRRIRA
jgi:hypothetical protein